MSESSGSAIEAIGLSKTYRRSQKPALSEIDLNVPRSKIFTLLGKNGAGKTTFLRIAATQLKPSAGKITVLGFDVTHQAKEVRHKISAIPQEMRPFQVLTPFDHVMMSLTSRGWSWQDARPKARSTLEELGLGQYEDTPTDDLSGGLRQRTLVAMALATDAELLFLDEPTIGLDPIARREVWKFMVELKRKDKTILLTTHYLDEAEAISDQIAIISGGKLLKVGSVQELKSSVGQSVRVDISSGFAEGELSSYGKVSRIGDTLRVLTDDRRANELLSLSIHRHARVNLSPISLDDVFVDLVGLEEEESSSW